MPVQTTPEKARSNADRVDILGVRVRPLSLAQTVDAVEDCIRRGERQYGVFINVYNVIEARRDAGYRQALNEADFPMADGIPLVWASRVLRDPVPGRVCGPDFLVAMNQRAADRGYTVYIMCGGDRKAERTAEAFQKIHPHIKVVGAWTPPWGPISEQNKVMLEYVVKVTRDATQCSPEDHKKLRAVGFDDRGILQITLITAWFNYINRVADALGVGRDGQVESK